MGSTKIINVLKDDRFEELLDIVKETDASEVVFVLPKKTKAFNSESQFAALEKEVNRSNKAATFMCSNPEVNDLAKKYNFDVLSSESESKSKAKPKSIKPARTEPVAVPVAVKNEDNDFDEADNNELEDEFGEHHPPFGKEPEEPEEVVEPFDDAQGREEEENSDDYKEEEAEPEAVEEDAPYGTELNESGDPIYEEEEEEEVGARRVPQYKFLATSAKTRGMADVFKPSTGKNIKVVQKDKRPVKLETHTEPADDIQSVWGKDSDSSGNIWADISKPQVTGKYKPKKGLNFNFGNFPKRGMVVLSAASILILGFVIFLTVGSARIEIKPRSQDISTQLKVTMSPNFPSVDNSFNRIPGQLFGINKSASGNFNATSEKDAIQKSRGAITIYNEYSTSPQPLVATTRFEYLKDGISSGLVFRTLQIITVPGMTVENGVVTPGKIDVEVIADKAGQTYNVSSGEFGIVAWRERGDTARYEKIYGRSADSMHGGILGKAKVVSEFDYNNAKDGLTAKVVDDINESLKSQSAGLELLANVEPKVDSIDSTAKIDDAADTFTMTVNGSIMTIGYKKEDLLALIAGHVEKTRGLMIVPDKLELSYKDIVVDPAKNTLEVVITIGGNAYAKIDRDSITANLMGKNELQIKDYLSSVRDIDSAKVILSPFWVKKIPRNEDKIDISLAF